MPGSGSLTHDVVSVCLAQLCSRPDVGASQSCTILYVESECGLPVKKAVMDL